MNWVVDVAETVGETKEEEEKKEEEEGNEEALRCFFL